MSYALARTKLANLLIKAGYDKKKSLKLVKYPYVETLHIRHNEFFWANNTKSIREYEFQEGYVQTPDDGVVRPNDLEYTMLGEKSKVKAYLRITASDISYWQSAYGHGTWWYSHPIRLIVKYRHTYPRNEIIDSYKRIGTGNGGVATSAGDYGHQEGTIPVPVGGWEKIEIDE